jgi:chromosomal replication initiation ATPase DnaA
MNTVYQKNTSTVVCKSYKVVEGALTTMRRGTASEPRNVCIYLTRHFKEDSLEEIVRECGVATYSSLSSLIERTKAMIAKYRTLRHRMKELKEEINMSQEHT